MAVGQVSFHSDKRVSDTLISLISVNFISLILILFNLNSVLIFEQVKRVYIAARENVIVNRLNKTKVERAVDHEAERIERVKKENAVKRAAANVQVILRPHSVLINHTDILLSASKSRSLWPSVRQTKLPGHTIY